MVKRITAINELRPRIKSQGVADLDTLAGRIARKSTTFDEDEMFGSFRKLMKEIMLALQEGETVKLDGVLNIVPSMKVGGEVILVLRANASAIATLNDETLWTTDKILNYANINKSNEALITAWNEANPDDPVEDTRL